MFSFGHLNFFPGFFKSIQIHSMEQTLLFRANFVPILQTLIHNTKKHQVHFCLIIPFDPLNLKGKIDFNHEN
jgi:hypothetical protein